MSFTAVRSYAANAAAMARSNQTNQALAMLADAVAELARSLDKELREIKNEVDTIRRRQN